MLGQRYWPQVGPTDKKFRGQRSFPPIANGRRCVGVMSYLCLLASWERVRRHVRLNAGGNNFFENFGNEVAVRNWTKVVEIDSRYI